MEDDVKFSKEEYELARQIVRPNGDRDDWPSNEIKMTRELVEKHGLETMWMHYRKMFMMYASKPLESFYLEMMQRRLHALSMLVWIYYSEKEDNDGLQG